LQKIKNYLPNTSVSPMSFLNTVISWYFKSRCSQIEHFKHNPIDVQEDILKKLLNQASNTEWGKKYHFSEISSYSEFRQRVPLQDYEDVKPYIDRLLKGEKNILWPGEIKWFAKSSGTTSDKSKFIPLSEESLEECHFRGGKDVMSIYCYNNPKTMIFSGKGLIMGGSHKVSEFNNNAYFGDLSAILLQNFPFWGEFLRTPELSLALLDDWEEKLQKIAHSSIKENVTSISGVPSWNLLLLKEILKITGRNNILEIWPNLELFIHGGVSFLPYREQFAKIIPGNTMHYLETYNASEGFFGIQDIPGSEEMLLMLDYGIFYEFIPHNSLNEETPHAISLAEVKPNVNYAMIISTNGGLWRYMIGDTIQFTSTKPYRFKISGRTRNFINAFGEEVIVENTDNALNVACRQTGAVITEYTAAPIFLGQTDAAAHEYIIEFETQPDSLEKFVDVLDKELQNLNSDYEAKRSADLMLKKPKIVLAPKNTFFNWLKSKGKIGGQNKVPRLFNGRKYVDEILKYISK
jgi:hypothetical protein